MPIFANPLGLLALLGIPAVLAIHFLQRRSVEIPISTLFLLERTQRDAASGRRIERIVPSLPLWMQLLAVLLLAWLLAEPRFRNATSVQRIAVVLDSSASMQVFKQAAIDRLLKEIPELQGPAGSVEITVLDSAPGRPRLFTGTDLQELGRTLRAWQPAEGVTDPTQALQLARSLVSREGAVIFLTDTPADSLPFDARLISVGSPVDNVGFTGVTFSSESGTPVWQALVRNYSNSAMDRTWTLQTADGASEPRPLHLEPGSLATVQAAFPAGARDVRVVLSPDLFEPDDVLPLVLPQTKSLAIFNRLPADAGDLPAKLLQAIDGIVATQDPAAADLTLAAYDPLDPELPSGNAILFVNDPTRAGAYLQGGILAEPGPLMESLHWQGLLVRESLELERRPGDTVLLWQDKRPLIFLRENPATASAPASRQLFFNFDLRLSNAPRQTAFIVLLHRFASALRDAKVAPAAELLETRQPVHLATRPGAAITTSFRNARGGPVQSGTTVPTHAPADPGFLTIRQDGEPLLEAAIHFADTREADFSACAPAEPVAPSGSASLSRHTRPDPFWRIALLAVLAALLVSWRFTRQPAAAQ